MAEEGLVFGLHAVTSALRHAPGEVQQVWLDRGRRDRALAEIRSLAAEHGVEIREVERRELDQLVPGGRHQGVVAKALKAPVATEADLDRLLDALESPLLLVLDGIQDPHNLGACLRTADAAGVHAVIAPADRAVGLTATARKVASGGAETVPFVQVTNLARTLERLKQRGIWFAGLAGEGDQSLYDLDCTGPLGLVLGAEGAGLRRLTRERCDWLVHIPMAGQVESLNVSVAAGVALFEAVRQRGQSG